jgi:hypothetical protein
MAGLLISGTWSPNAALDRGFNADARAGPKDTSYPSFPPNTSGGESIELATGKCRAGFAKARSYYPLDEYDAKRYRNTKISKHFDVF